MGKCRKFVLTRDFSCIVKRCRKSLGGVALSQNCFDLLHLLTKLACMECYVFLRHLKNKFATPP